MFGSRKHCRWDGKAYTAKQPHDKDGFCSPACKQAHHRAFKKYVTAKQGPSRSSKNDRKKQ